MLDFPVIAISIAEWAYMETKKCFSGNCILKLVEKVNINKVAFAAHLARSDVYHTNANHAHEELRELLKIGRCQDTAKVVTYFGNKNVFTSEPVRIKVSCFSEYSFLS
jgi:adenylate cyclase class IV